MLIWIQFQLSRYVYATEMLLWIWYVVCMYQRYIYTNKVDVINLFSIRFSNQLLCSWEIPICFNYGISIFILIQLTKAYILYSTQVIFFQKRVQFICWMNTIIKFFIQLKLSVDVEFTLLYAWPYLNCLIKYW